MTDTQLPTIQELKEQIELKESQLKRKVVVDKYKDFIDNLCNRKSDGKNPKGIRYRRFLQNALRVGAETVFPTENDEYLFIGKPDRGMFCGTLTMSGKPNFKVDEMKILGEIMEEWGTWDY